ncbi:hypothetical protein ABE288_21535 [Bacillus salipaludis]|uniref:hypothetical protein n=1 Tax=Bacillus salipaludis TaxID=2547811 RepID=UPI003D246008
MSDEPQEQLEEDSQTLKNEIKHEIKHELKAEFSNFRQKRKRLLVYSVCLFALGVLIGFGGGRATHFDHHYEHDHIQKWHHKQK